MVQAYFHIMVIYKSLINFFICGIILIMLTSCKNNVEGVKKIGVSENEPIGVAEHINLIYTDSGSVIANSKSPKMLDYSNKEYAFNDYRIAIDLALYYEINQISNIIVIYIIVTDK